MNFTDTIDNLPVQPRKRVIKSLIGSLNSSVIGNLRSHIRTSKYENVSRQGSTPTIDDYNDAVAEVSARKADAQQLEDGGMRQTMPSIEVAHKLEAVRAYLIHALAAIATLPSDVPLNIADTIDFQIERQPDINEPALRALAQAINTDFEVLKTAKVKIYNDDRAELIDMRGQIIDLVSSLDVSDEADAAQAAFDSLPVQLQYRLFSSLATALKKAANNALERLLRYNSLDAAGDITLLKAEHNAVVAWVHEFSTRNRQELAEYMERGGQLPELMPLA